MAFQTYDELIKMASQNPKQATDLVKRAQQRSVPVVSANNPGYADDPRMAAMKRQQKLQSSAQPQDDTVSNRKNVGY